MRVGIDASNLRAGGGITHLAALLDAASPEPHGISRVVVWAGRNTRDHLPRAPWLTLAEDGALDGDLTRRLLWQRFALGPQARQACDILFVPGGSYSGSFRPFVTMSRSLLPFEPGERQRYGVSRMAAKMAILRLGQTATFRRANAVIFLTEYARQVVCATTGPLRGTTAIVPHGVSNVFFCGPRPQKMAAEYTVDRPFRLLYVSTVDVYKHQWHVVEAVATLRARGVPVALELVGSAYPPALARLLAAISAADPDARFVAYRGALRHTDLPARYHAADGFVFASSCENMPNTLLEAMAAGLPIACSDRGPMPGVLGDAGLYFDPEQPGTLARALETLIADDVLRTRLAVAAHARAGQYSWARTADRTWALLADVFARHRRQVSGPSPARGAVQNRP